MSQFIMPVEEKMAKKIFALCAVMTVCGAVLFAQEEEHFGKKPGIFSAGLGGSFSADFLSYFLTSAGKDALGEETPAQIGGGFFAFIDVKYIEYDLGLNFLNDADADLSMTSFEIQLIGKYPIVINNRLAMLPLIGVGFRMVLAQTPSAEGESPVEMQSNVWFKWGWGADFAFTERIYLRPRILYGIGTNSKSQKEQIDHNNRNTKMIEQIINHGFDVGFAVGYRF
jgi:opacity protein-like surface antigen